MLGLAYKAPEDVLDYSVDFSPWLDTGDTVQSADATTTSDSVTVDSVSVVDQKVIVWLSGGETGETACIEVVITTSDGRKKTAVFKIRIKGGC